MPGVVNTTDTFTTNQVITSTLMNNIIDQTQFTSTALAAGTGTLSLVDGRMKVATGGITSNEMAVDAITTNAIAANAVTTAKILDANVTTAKILDANVTTAKILDANVTTAKIADAAITPAKLNGAQSGSAPIFGARAWVNFNGTANSNLSGTYSQSVTTVTVTATAHGLIVGSSINADITTGSGVDGIYTVATVTDANTFTYTAGTSLTTSGSVTLLRNTINASGNVSSITDVGIGHYQINFTTAMQDVNYVTVGTTNNNAGDSSRPVIVIPITNTTSSVTIKTLGTFNNNAAIDCSQIFLAVFR